MLSRLLKAACISSGVMLAACTTTGGAGPGTAAPLAGKEWVVQDIGGRGVIDNSRPTLLFSSDGRLSGSASCNRLVGSYSVVGSKLTISQAGITMMACAPALMDQEKRLVDALNTVKMYKIDAAGALVLSSNAGAIITAR